MLLEQELVEKYDVEQQVVQVILELASPESLDDYRSEAAAVSCSSCLSSRLLSLWCSIF